MPDVVVGREEKGHVLCSVFLILRCIVPDFHREHNQKEKPKESDWKSGLSFIFVKMHLIAQVLLFIFFIFFFFVFFSQNRDPLHSLCRMRCGRVLTL